MENGSHHREMQVTEADGGYCLVCRLRAYFVSGEWWCKYQHHDGSENQNSQHEAN